MKVLTTRGGELATVCGPTCSWSDCKCWKHGVGLESGYPVDDGLIVAERDGFTLDDLKSACTAFLQRTGWSDDDGEIAEMMSEEAAEIADRCSPGTRLWPRYSPETEEWDWYDEYPDGPLTLTEVLTLNTHVTGCDSENRCTTVRILGFGQTCTAVITAAAGSSPSKKDPIDHSGSRIPKCQSMIQVSAYREFPCGRP